MHWQTQREGYFVLPFSTVAVTVGNQGKRKAKAGAITVLGQHLIKVRQELELSQKQAAGQIGVSQTTYCSWERGIGNPDILSMQKVIAFLGYYPFPEPTTFAGKIKKYWQIHGLTYLEFGNLFNASEATAWTWENEKYVPDSRMRDRILTVFG